MKKTTKTFVIFLISSITLLFSIAFANTQSTTKAGTEIARLENNAPAKPISLNFRNIPVRDLLQVLAEFANKNIVVSEKVKGKMSINLEKVPWQKALATILHTQNLKAKTKDGVILVLPTKKLLAKKTLAKKADAKTIFYRAHYAKAADLAKLLEKSRGLLSEKGNVTFDARTNSLWIKDSPEQLKNIRRYLQKIDVAVPQILIEARIVYVDENFLQELGIKFGASQENQSQLSGAMNMDLPTNVIDTGRANLAIAKLGRGVLLDLELAALENEGRAKIISQPKLVTADRTSAYIEAGDEIPYQEKTGNGNTSTAFKKAVLGLKVTPELTDRKRINLILKLNQDKVTPLSINGEPTIQTRQLQTQVLVQNGQTIVLGGIYEETHNHVQNRVPFLGKLPGLGILFRSNKIQTERKELLIFVTPKVLRGKQ